jgi:triosephosphate isomerase
MQKRPYNDAKTILSPQRVGRLLERAKDSGRSDDTIEVIRRRFKTHVDSCLPILERFRAEGTPLHTIDSARSVDTVYASVARLFGADGLQAFRPEGSVAAHIDTTTTTTNRAAAAATNDDADDAPPRRRYLVAGNWKCNGTWDENLERVAVLNALGPIPANAEVALCVPFVAIPMLLSGLRRDIAVGAQNCGANAGNGAFTGEVGAHQLAALGCAWVIVGHSERRAGFGGKSAVAAALSCGEPDDLCAQKCKVAIDHGLRVMFAIGEQQEDRDSGRTMEVCARQLRPLATLLSADDWTHNVAIAYEPVWAIGTGRTATPELAQATHASIRHWIATNVSEAVAATVRIQYGGSMKGANAGDLLAQPDIDGGLIGGASLTADLFRVLDGIPSE